MKTILFAILFYWWRNDSYSVRNAVYMTEISDDDIRIVWRERREGRRNIFFYSDWCPMKMMMKKVMYYSKSVSILTLNERK